MLVTPAVLCGVISAGWPTFAVAAKSRGWKIQCIVAMNNKWVPRIRQMFGDVSIFEVVEGTAEGLGARVTPMVWLCDVEPSRRLKI